MANEMRDRFVELMNDFYYSIESLTREQIRQIADHLIENGVIVPPCEVGDTVYYINRFYHIELRKDTIYKAKVVRIVTNSLGTSLVIQIRNESGCTELSNIDCVETPNIEDFSRTVFLTKEQAEQKLKEMRASNG